MQIVHEDQGRTGVFAIGEGEDRAELTYAPAGIQDSLIFDHTYVPAHLRGQGIAERLVDHAVAYAREQGKTVVPACSYVRALFDRHPERYAAIRTEEDKPVGRI
ncbi:N-acetyltransferase [Aureimonas flava]|uniref:N-acetyltransferase n=1 Tax=Aureimonas flava TaxID=2320271 RepID=A0A3A1WVQ9_9HYPH|nr:GNAT family N-acetyltransferase [Aureimonas flava]RIY02428.1 N-acetyltransferase [Aureimonas flava]